MADSMNDPNAGALGRLVGTNNLQRAADSLERTIYRVEKSLAVLGQSKAQFSGASGGGPTQSSNGGGATFSTPTSPASQTGGSHRAEGPTRFFSSSTPNGGARMGSTPSGNGMVAGGFLAGSAYNYGKQINGALGFSAQQDADDSRLYSTMGRMSFMGGKASRSDLERLYSNGGRFSLSTEDYTQSMYGASQMSGYAPGSSGFSKFNNSAASISMMDPTKSQSQAVATNAQFYTAAGYSNMRRVGITTVGKGGTQADIVDIANKVLKQVDPKGSIRDEAGIAALIGSGMSPLNITLQNWVQGGIIGPDQAEAIKKQIEGILKARAQGVGVGTLKDLRNQANSGSNSAMSTLKSLGIADTAMQSDKNLEADKRQRAVRQLSGFEGTLAKANEGLGKFADIIDDITKSIPGLNTLLGGVNALRDGGPGAALGYLMSEGSGLAANLISAIPGFASGGSVKGPGGPKDDKIPAWLSNGEFVMNAEATKRNRPLLEHMNAKKYAQGGHVSRNEAGGAGGLPPGVRVVTANIDFTRGNDAAQLAHLASTADILLLQEAKDVNLDAVLPRGWMSNQDTRNSATAGSAIAWNAAKLGNNIGSSGLAFGAIQDGGRSNTRYISYIDSRIGKQPVRLISCHFPLKSRGSQAAMEKQLRQVIAKRPRGSEWVVGLDANQDIFRLAKRLGGVANGRGIVGEIVSRGLARRRGSVDTYGIKNGMTDHASVGLDIGAGSVGPGIKGHTSNVSATSGGGPGSAMASPGGGRDGGSSAGSGFASAGGSMGGMSGGFGGGGGDMGAINGSEASIVAGAMGGGGGGGSYAGATNTATSGKSGDFGAGTQSPGGNYPPVAGLGKVKPWVADGAAEFKAKFGGLIRSIGGYRTGARDPNGHPAGLALDLMTGTADATRLAAYARANAKRMGVLYVIYRQKIWNVERSGEGWRPMEDRGSATQNHMDHVHVSFTAKAPAGGKGKKGNVSGNRATGQRMNSKRGWGQHWNALEELWTRESNWNHTADNPTSSAYGIPQALPGSKMAAAGSDWKTNPKTQIEWGLDYIGDRYGNPTKALEHFKKHQWYDKGAWEIKQDETARVHKGEMIFPKNAADQIRDILMMGNSWGTQGGRNSGKGGGGGVSIVFQPGSIVVRTGGSANAAGAKAIGRELADQVVNNERIRSLARGR